jgi:hypothetical protein
MWKERSPRPDLVLAPSLFLAAASGAAESLYLDEIPVAATGLPLVGWPARVVLGVVLVPQESTVRAFGHAWTEIHDGRRWQRADATATEPLRTLATCASALRRRGPGVRGAPPGLHAGALAEAHRARAGEALRSRLA